MSHGFVSLKALSGRAPASPAEVLQQIRDIYFKTTKQTIHDDFAHAIELLKSLPDEESRERAAVFMEGIAQMRKDWARQRPTPNPQRPKPKVQKAKDPRPKTKG